MDHTACNDLGLTRAGTSYELKIFAVVLNRTALRVGEVHFVSSETESQKRHDPVWQYRVA